MSEKRTDDLTHEELVRLLDATRAMARATVEPRFDDIMAMVLDVALSATKSDRAGLYMLEPNGEAVLVGRHPPPDADTVRRVHIRGTPLEEPLTTGRPKTYKSAELGDRAEPHRTEGGIVHIAVVPVDVRGKPGASFNIARKSVTPYDERELRFAQILGELLVVYIDNARLYADAQQRLGETRMLVEVSRAVSASPDLTARLDASATVLAQMLDASNAYIMLLAEGGTVLEGVTSSNVEKRTFFREVRLSLAETSVASRAVMTKQPVVVEDTSAPTDVKCDLAARFGEKSIVALPLLLRDEVIGVVILDDTRRVRSWPAAEIQRAELIAQTIAVGIANARLYEEVRRRSEELERAQAELVKRERLAALGQLAAVMAHEVRNPLGVLFNSLGTLAKQVPADGAASELIGIMSEEARRLERLVRELLDFAKPLAPSFESEAVRPLLLGAVDAATRELGPTMVPRIEVAVAPDLPPVWIDASMMRRALVNLVVNAVHAVGPEGHVDVRTSLETREQRRLVRVDVSDSGPGIAPDVAPRVFEPFFTTKATGTGLGLAVVKSIVESHGGEITLESKAGAGTTVSMLLPLAPEGVDGQAPKSKRTAW